MNTPNPKTQDAAATKSSKTKDANQEASQSAETLQQQLMVMLEPLLKFHKASEAMAANDVTLYWDIRLVRGRAEPVAHTEPFAHMQGSSSFNNMLAYNMRLGATSVIEHEINEKVMMPLIARLQEAIDNETLADLAARKQATEAEADDEEDDDAWTDNPATP
jgi:hypothetical protein